MAELDPWETAPTPAPTPPPTHDPWETPPPPEQPAGIPGAIGTGLYHGAMNIAALPGNLDEFARMVGHYAAEKISGRTLPMPERLGAGVVPTGPELESRVTQQTGFKPAEAKPGTGAAIAEEVAGFVPGALTMPAKTGGEVAMNLLKYAAAPYGAAKGAGFAADVAGAGPEAKAIAETAAGMGTAALAARAGKPPMVAPTTEEIKASGRAKFSQAKAMDVKITQPAVDRIVTAMEDYAKDDRLKPYVEKQTLNLLDEFRAQRASDVDWQDMMKDRAVFRKIERDDLTSHQGKATSDGMAAGRMVDIIDREMGNVPDAEITGAGNPDEIRRLYKEGNRDWKMYRDAEAIDDAFYSADISAKAARGDYDGAVRDAFRRLAKPGQIERFSPDAQDAILEAVKADKVERAQRFIAKFSPEQRPWSSLIGAVVAGHAVGPLGSLAIPAAGALGNWMAGARTLGQAQRASAIVRGGVQPPNLHMRQFPWMASQYLNMATTPPGGL